MTTSSSSVQIWLLCRRLPAWLIALQLPSVGVSLSLPQVHDAPLVHPGLWVLGSGGFTEPEAPIRTWRQPGTQVFATDLDGDHMPTILVLNRMHLDEWPSGQVAEILNDLKGHRGIIGFTREAPDASQSARRGYEANITECFPGNPHVNKEQQDAWQISTLAQQADLVLDIHGTRNNGWDFPFYGPTGGRSPLVTGTASLLGRDRVAILAEPHPAGVLTNYVGWDLSPATTVLPRLHTWLSSLARGWQPPARPMTEYRIVDGIRESDALRLGLQREYSPFARLPDKAIRALGLPIPAYAFSWGADLYRHTGYWGEVAVPERAFLRA